MRKKDLNLKSNRSPFEKYYWIYRTDQIFYIRMLQNDLLDQNAKQIPVFWLCK